MNKNAYIKGFISTLLKGAQYKTDISTAGLTPAQEREITNRFGNLSLPKRWVHIRARGKNSPVARVTPILNRMIGLAPTVIVPKTLNYKDPLNRAIVWHELGHTQYPGKTISYRKPLDILKEERRAWLTGRNLARQHGDTNINFRAFSQDPKDTYRNMVRMDILKNKLKKSTNYDITKNLGQKAFNTALDSNRLGSNLLARINYTPLDIAKTLPSNNLMASLISSRLMTPGKALASVPRNKFKQDIQPSRPVVKPTFNQQLRAITPTAITHNIATRVKQPITINRSNK